MFDYQAQQPDELSLMRGDVVKVYRKMVDGESSYLVPTTNDLGPSQDGTRVSG